MSKYQLRIVNKSGSPRRFFFFTAPPVFSGSVAAKDIYTNTWVSVYVANKSAATVTTQLDFYAFCGPKTEVSGKTIIETGSSRDTPAKLGSNSAKGSSYLTYWDQENQNFRWDDQDQPDSAAPGCYSITTDHGFTLNDNVTIGLAMMKQGDEFATPVTVIKAQPGMKYDIAPVVKFYVATGDKKYGELFDFVAQSTESGEYDFSSTGGGSGYNSGDITYDNHGQWTQTKYTTQSLMSLSGFGGDPSKANSVDWLKAFVKFTRPILDSHAQNVLYEAARHALSEIEYNPGPLYFSEDGKTLTIRYEFPLPDGDGGDDYPLVSKPLPWYPTKPDSEVFISIDARNEILQVKFTPSWQKIQELTGDFGNTSLGAPAVPKALASALDDQINAVSGELPNGETWTITA
ncbi:hypothetical protein TWF788_003554 [Orbilia oligospora]|uniref:Uncharacterized protein n=2 Tax=Orbilia oligospora TaxID=2813651 RepID=A0A6G1MKH0_ORBOL|nr:hypothetical protein TWF788_003554 [Orbilia oligospora]KAF3212483.1 hypothetical protein TWF191_010482 [Orbilia oligospora]KAF3261071.1 hypothetical protein TWF192_009003 [Orbilia oligospora]